MTARTYLIVCALTALATALAVLYVPGLSDTIEAALLGFLATAAR